MKNKNELNRAILIFIVVVCVSGLIGFGIYLYSLTFLR